MAVAQLTKCIIASALTVFALSGCQSLHGIRAEPLPDQASAGIQSPHRVEAASQPSASSPSLRPPAEARKPSPMTSTSTDMTAEAIKVDSVDAVLMNAPGLWGRLRRGFALPPLQDELVGQFARKFASTNFIEHRADRIWLFMPLIVEELQARQMPLELAMPSLVESALNPQAVSRVGATGTWHIMAPTGRCFELRQSRLVDDRKNLREATRAALTYLSKLHDQLGDWHLAMAAYNCGEGRVQSLINRARAQGQETGYPALAERLPKEARNYVPQIIAWVNLAARPSAQAVTLLDMPNGNPLTEVTVT